jgi:hypothetical protein
LKGGLSLGYFSELEQMVTISHRSVTIDNQGVAAGAALIWIECMTAVLTARLAVPAEPIQFRLLCKQEVART